MSGLTPEARERVERYVRAARASLRGSAVDAREVEADLRAHIGDALAASPAPISQATVDSVLERLGHPDQWADAAGIPAWRRVANRLMVGPEDWRLPYLSFGLVALGGLTLPVGGIVLIAAAYFFARAAVALLEERAVPLGPRAWLVYPALIAGTAPFFLVPLVAPVILIASFGVEQAGFLRLAGAWPGSLSGVTELRINAGFLALAAGAWWMVLAGIAAAAWPAIRVLLAPFPIALRRSQTAWLFGAGAVVAIAGAAVLWTPL
jgi:hypothetical protein